METGLSEFFVCLGLINTLLNKNKMSDDDLDNFFDEVEEVVEEAKKDSENEAYTVDDAIKEKQQNDTDSGAGVLGVDDKSRRPAKKARTDLKDYGTRIVSSIQPGCAAVVVSKKSTTVTSKISAAPVMHNAMGASTNGGIYQITVPQECLNQPNPPPPPPAPPVPPPPPPPPATYQFNGNVNNTSKSSSKPSLRVAAGKNWTDATLSEFPENDYRLFVGNLDKIITEAKLAEAFQSKYPSFAMCRIIYDKISGTSKGFGFVSLMDPKDLARAIREMDQSWLGSRPIKVKRSDWKERDVREIRKGKKKKGRGRR